MAEALLRSLIRARHLEPFEAFEAAFRKAASGLAGQEHDPSLKRTSVSQRSLERWCSGHGTMPHAPTRRVLEHMFGQPISELLAAPEPDNQPGMMPGREIGRTLEMAARRAQRFSLAADATNVGLESIGQLRDEAVRLAGAYPVQPLADLLPELVQLQDDTLTLLEGRQPPALTRELYVIGGLSSGLLSKASHDLRDARTAMTHARLAWQCANLAGHASLSAWVRGLESLIKYWAQQPREAAAYARAGLEIDGVTGTVRVWLHALEGRALAVLGDVDGALLAIDRAADARDHTQADDLDGIGGLCSFTAERQLYYAADAGAMLPAQLTASQLGRRATGYAEQAIAAYEASPQPAFGDLAGARAALAISRVRAGELEGAAEAIDPVLALLPTQRINGVVACTLAVHRELAAHPTSPVAAEVQEAIEVFATTPAAAITRG